MTNQFSCQAVNSTAISAIGFNYTNNTLRVVFRNGSAYTYAGVSADLFDAMSEAPSVGVFYNQMIRRRFPSTRMEADRAMQFIFTVFASLSNNRVVVEG